ncbi:endoglucanase type K [Apiospora kogelbergensis]|uniref:endoglucanase type K n=1 Tax=Apiospora kogelbergensis TaxID=1337665 RepID=UPI00312DFF80
MHVHSVLATAAAAATLPLLASAQGASGNGRTTRYWDCCKPSCGWGLKTNSGKFVQTCDKSDGPLGGSDTKSGCDNGVSSGAYMCSNQSPWAVNETTAYGWAAVKLAGSNEQTWCCACYELTFTSGPVSGKKMIVQASNTGMPGGGVGLFNACTNQYGAPPNGWGAQYGGVSSRSACDSFPEKLKAGCYWRFDWFAGADNPEVTFKQVACPAALTAKSGCSRNNDAINETPTGPSSVGTWTPGATAAPTGRASFSG